LPSTAAPTHASTRGLDWRNKVTRIVRLLLFYYYYDYYYY
jgi:hypothetical protein